jgi:hypothetical protein
VHVIAFFRVNVAEKEYEAKKSHFFIELMSNEKKNIAN